MIDSNASASDGDAPQREPLRHWLAAFLAELQASKDALDAAFHFDDRAQVKPAYDRLMRLAAAAHPWSARATPPQAQAAPAATDDEALIAIADAILAVLHELSAGIERYHTQSATLARLQTRLAAALAGQPPE